MEHKDYYKILSASIDANCKTIKRVYRQLARQCHPDNSPGDEKAEETFNEIMVSN
ncbi:MAG: DnaJ domain-containing protein [Anaerolineaceae bacterium]|nr:MAG: DnaJ domain-containing protein [Anaerolineaceae bacterium]